MVNMVLIVYWFANSAAPESIPVGFQQTTVVPFNSFSQCAASLAAMETLAANGLKITGGCLTM